MSCVVVCYRWALPSVWKGPEAEKEKQRETALAALNQTGKSKKGSALGAAERWVNDVNRLLSPSRFDSNKTASGRMRSFFSHALRVVKILFLALVSVSYCELLLIFDSRRVPSWPM